MDRDVMARQLGVVLRPAMESMLAGLVGLAVGAVIMALWGHNPVRAYQALFVGAFGDSYGWAESLAYAVPLILTALTFAVGVRAGMFNIGAEGQVYLGAMAAITVAYFPLPSGWHHVVGLALAATAGALWSLGPALLKITRGVHEVISTIMFNWISRWLCFYLIANVLVDPRRAEKTVSIPRTARFPILIRGTDLTASIFVAVGFTVLLYFLLWHTVTGYEVRAAGLSPTAAKYGGISSRRTMALSFLLGGMAAGLAGAVLVMGVPPTYAEVTGLGYTMGKGFDGMAVAMVGRTHPLGILFSAVFFGGLSAGGRAMQGVGVPLEMVRVVSGVIIFAMAVPELARVFRLVRQRRLLVKAEA